MKNILVLSNVGMLSAAFRYRIYNTLSLLEKEGYVHTDVLCLYSDSTMRTLNGRKQILKVIKVCYDLLLFVIGLYKIRKNKYDAVIVKTNLFPILGANIERKVSFLVNTNKWIYDIDDAVYFNYTRAENALFAKVRDLKSKVGFWLSKADKVTLSNRIIFDDLHKIYGLSEEKCSFFLSSPYCNQYFNVGEDISIGKDENRIIWLGSAHTQSELYLLENFINGIKNYIPNVEIILMGCEKDFPLFRNIEYVTFVEWSPENERREMRRASFGLNPLRDDMFQKRKSAFKVIQYYRAGVIPIVSNVGINRDLINKYRGYVVDSFDDIDGIAGFMNEACVNIREYRLSMFLDSSELSTENIAGQIKNLI